MTYVVDGIGEFHSLGDALQAAIVHPESGGQPTLALQKAKPSAPLATAPATDDTLTTVLLVGVAALVAYLVYDAVKQDDKAEAAEADDEDEDEEDEEEDEEPAKEDE